MSEVDSELMERVARLEREVARLAGMLERTGPVPAPVRAPVPAAPRVPARSLNPVFLVAAVGAAIFLAGAAFFLHLAIQQGWIGPGARFAMGLLAGCGLGLAGGRMLLRQAPALGTCLLSAGLGTLLFTLYAGAFRYHFYLPPAGFMGTGLVTLLAGAMAARARSGAALCAALLVALAAPEVFSQGGHHEIALAMYLAVVMGAALLVPYLAGTGGRWTVARWLAVAGVWLLLWAAGERTQRYDAGLYLALVLVHYGLAAVWIWLPGQGEDRPSSPTLLWVFTTLVLTAALWAGWRDLHLQREAFALPVAALALASLGLVKAARRRLGDDQADQGLLVLAGGLLALVVPVALDWAWVGPVWGLYAAGLAWTAGRAEENRGWGEEVRALTVLAVAMAALASLRWAIDLGDLPRAAVPAPLFSATCADGALAALAWGFLARRQGLLGKGAFAALQVTGNLLLAQELGRAVGYAGLGERAADIARTLGLAASGALQWIRSLRTAGVTGVGVAAYLLLLAAGGKLIAWDLAQAGTPLRALVFLAVGGILLAAAVVGNRVRTAARLNPE